MDLGLRWRLEPLAMITGEFPILERVDKQG